MLDKKFTDDINSVVHGPKTISCLRVALLCDCFNLFIKFCNVITVSASLKERHNIYRRLFISMMQSKNLSSSVQSGNITGKALRTSECHSNLKDWKDFILSYRRASKGLRSITSKWKFFSHDETISLAIILDVNQRGFVSWSDLCILGEMVFDVYRRDVAHPVRAYRILYKSILQSLNNMCGTVIESSTIDKIRKVASWAREQTFQPLELFEEYIKARNSVGNFYSEDGSTNWVTEFLTELQHRTQESRDSLARNQLSSHTVASSLADSVSRLSAISIGTLDSAGSFRFLKNAKLMMSTDTPCTTR